MGNCNCGSGSSTVVLIPKTDVATKDSSCCGPESADKTIEAGCCSDSDACCIDCGCNSSTAVTETVSTGKSSCC